MAFVCSIHQRRMYPTCPLQTWNWQTFHGEIASSQTSFLYCINIPSACAVVLHFVSTNFVHTCLNIFTAVCGSATINLGSKLASFLAKLYFSGHLSYILVTIVANIAQHSFLNSYICSLVSSPKGIGKYSCCCKSYINVTSCQMNACFQYI